ncbi:MAG TPA: hypothetical protein ENJ21_01200 [Chromatiaceae bacterium]|nr:hypothetical protein [Chromatiaceae bacterium]
MAGSVLARRVGWNKRSGSTTADLFERSLPAWDTVLYNEYHALIVEHAKQHCRVKPVCRSCPVSPDCGYPLIGGSLPVA